MFTIQPAVPFPSIYSIDIKAHIPKNLYMNTHNSFIFILVVFAVVFCVVGIIDIKKDIKGKTDEELEEELVREYIISKIKQPQMGVDKKTVVDLQIYNTDYSKEEIISNRWRIKDEKSI